MINKLRTLSIATILLVLAACAAGTAAAPAVGMWDVNISTPVGDQAGVWTINADGTGIMGGEQGDQAIAGIMMDGNSLSFDVDIDAGGQALSLSFSGTVEGDTISGEFASDFGAFAISGTRQ